MGKPGRPAGDGFFIRHGAETENTWYNPGWWHTGEDWYAQQGDTAGAQVYAIADGEVVYADANYPGRVVIVRHADDLYSMYGHLDPKLAVQVGSQVERGDLIGTVLRRGDTTPNHLHFEIRTFFTRREVNGAAPRYGYRCGPDCPPGPGYWPIDAPELPDALGGATRLTSLRIGRSRRAPAQPWPSRRSRSQRASRSGRCRPARTRDSRPASYGSGRASAFR
ncbi:MAG: M23 family metallopeptidase [Kouleothrix sp.]|nr:M23 family metallopeptidase [Kouleothrix sp.]